jgi:hypothetical protein
MLWLSSWIESGKDAARLPETLTPRRCRIAETLRRGFSGNCGQVRFSETVIILTPQLSLIVRSSELGEAQFPKFSLYPTIS